MQADKQVTFVFSRDWTHAGVTYKPGEEAQLKDWEVAKLTNLGAGKAKNSK